MVAVGDVGAVSKVEQFLAGQQFLHLFDYAEAPDSRVQNADGGG